MNNHSIFVVIGITDLDFSNSLYFLGSTRRVGWYNSFNEAEEAILQNSHHSHKFFNWFVIEETAPGFYSELLSRICYRWNESTNQYEEVMEPECLNDYPNLGLG